MSKIPKAILDGSKSTSCVDSKSRIIDLSMAENWLVRPEILELCKAAIDTKFQASVSHLLDYFVVRLGAICLTNYASISHGRRASGAIPRF